MIGHGTPGAGPLALPFGSCTLVGGVRLHGFDPVSERRRTSLRTCWNLGSEDDGWLGGPDIGFPDG